MVGLRLVWGIPLIVDKFKLHNISKVVELRYFTLELLSVKLEFHCFYTILGMICVSDNNHFLCYTTML